MTDRDQDTAPTPPPPGPGTPPLSSKELAADAGAADPSAPGGVRDRGKVLEGHTRPDEISIVQGDIDEPGNAPDEIVNLPPD